MGENWTSFFFSFFFCSLDLIFRGHRLISPCRVWLSLSALTSKVSEVVMYPDKMCQRGFVEYRKSGLPMEFFWGLSRMYFLMCVEGLRYLIAVSSYVFLLLSNNTGLGPSIVNCHDVMTLNCVSRPQWMKLKYWKGASFRSRRCTTVLTSYIIEASKYPRNDILRMSTIPGWGEHYWNDDSSVIVENMARTIATDWSK